MTLVTTDKRHAYRVIVADPPWHYDGFAGSVGYGGKFAGREGLAPVGVKPLPYPSMSLDEIAALPVCDLAAGHSWLFLWATNRYLPDAFAIAGAWGFKYAQTIVWHKTSNVPPFGGTFTTYEGPPPAIGKRHKLTKPYAAVTKDKQQLIAFGFQAYDSFESSTTAQTGIVTIPAPWGGDSVVGGHEMVICGYLASQPDYALVRNSWGSGWGIGGYCLFPWSYMLSNLCSDLRTIVREPAP